MPNQNEASIDSLLFFKKEKEIEICNSLLHVLVDVILFLSERGLPRGGSFIELVIKIILYCYFIVVKILVDHLKKVKRYQSERRRLMFRYLSPRIQNEFTSCSANHVTKKIFINRFHGRHFSFRTSNLYCKLCLPKWQKWIWSFERFLELLNFSVKTGEAVTGLIMSVLSKYNIPVVAYKGIR